MLQMTLSYLRVSGGAGGGAGSMALVVRTQLVGVGAEEGAVLSRRAGDRAPEASAGGWGPGPSVVRAEGMVDASGRFHEF